MLKEVVSPEDEGGVGWEKMHLEETPWDTEKIMVIVGLSFAIFSIGIVFAIWTIYRSIVTAMLVDAIIFAVLIWGIFAYGYLTSRCPSCRRPWSRLTVARKIGHVKDENESPYETFQQSLRSSDSDSEGPAPLGQHLRLGRVVNTFTRTTHVLYYKCKYCGYGWNSEGDSVVGETHITGRYRASILPSAPGTLRIPLDLDSNAFCGWLGRALQQCHKSTRAYQAQTPRILGHRTRRVLYGRATPPGRSGAPLNFSGIRATSSRA
jgi:hypothetical protein